MENIYLWSLLGIAAVAFLYLYIKIQKRKNYIQKVKDSLHNNSSELVNEVFENGNGNGDYRINDIDAEG